MSILLSNNKNINGDQHSVHVNHHFKGSPKEVEGAEEKLKRLKVVFVAPIVISWQIGNLFPFPPLFFYPEVYTDIVLMVFFYCAKSSSKGCQIRTLPLRTNG